MEGEKGEGKAEPGGFVLEPDDVSDKGEKIEKSPEKAAEPEPKEEEVVKPESKDQKEEKENLSTKEQIETAITAVSQVTSQIKSFIPPEQLERLQ